MLNADNPRLSGSDVTPCLLEDDENSTKSLELWNDTDSLNYLPSEIICNGSFSDGSGDQYFFLPVHDVEIPPVTLEDLDDELQLTTDPDPIVHADKVEAVVPIETPAKRAIARFQKRTDAIKKLDCVIQYHQHPLSPSQQGTAVPEKFSWLDHLKRASSGAEISTPLTGSTNSYYSYSDALYSATDPRQACPETSQHAVGDKANFSDVLFIMDWDDTILPTSALREFWRTYCGAGSRPALSNPPAFQGMPLLNAFPDIPQSEILEETFKMVGRVTQDLLSYLVTEGTVIFITNASTDWIRSSCTRFMPDLLPTLENIQRISAKDDPANSQKSPDKWKISTFRSEITRWCKSRDTANVSPNGRTLFSIGDSIHERAALWGHYDATCDGVTRARSLKLVSFPTVGIIIGQLFHLKKVLPCLLSNSTPFYKQMAQNIEFESENINFDEAPEGKSVLFKLTVKPLPTRGIVTSKLASPKETSVIRTSPLISAPAISQIAWNTTPTPTAAIPAVRYINPPNVLGNQVSQTLVIGSRRISHVTPPGQHNAGGETPASAKAAT